MQKESYELIHPGQLSKPLEKALQLRGKELSDAKLSTLISDTEQTRADYQAKAILTGIALLAKKFVTKHGKWKAYCEKLFENGSTAAILDFEASYRTIRLYTQLARRFLWKIETDGFAQEVVETDRERIPVTAQQITALAVSDSEAMDPIFEQLHHFVAGRSLRRMLADFRQAEKDADEEDRQAALEAAKTENRSTGNETTGGEAASPKPIQLLLWESYCRDTAPMLDRLFDRPGTEDLRGEEAIAYYSNIASELEERAKRARQLAEAAKQGQGA